MKFIIGVQNMGNSIQDNKLEICEICRKKLSDAIEGSNSEFIEFKIVDATIPDEAMTNVRYAPKQIERLQQHEDINVIKKKYEDVLVTIKKLLLMSIENGSYLGLCGDRTDNSESINTIYEKVNNSVLNDQIKDKLNNLLFQEDIKQLEIETKFDISELKYYKHTVNKEDFDKANTVSDVGRFQKYVNILISKVNDLSNELNAKIQIKIQMKISDKDFTGFSFTKEKLKDFLTDKTVEGGDKVVIYICPESNTEKEKFKKYINTLKPFVAENNNIYHALFHSTEVAFWVHQTDHNNTTLVYVPDRPPHPFELKFKTVNTSTSQ